MDLRIDVAGGEKVVVGLGGAEAESGASEGRGSLDCETTCRTCGWDLVVFLGEEVLEGEDLAAVAASTAVVLVD